MYINIYIYIYNIVKEVIKTNLFFKIKDIIKIIIK
jgi:hypothetical protein